MANTPTLILGSDTYNVTPDVNGVPVLLNAGDTPSIAQGTLANRPVAGTLGRLYYDTDRFIFYRDDSTNWTTIGGKEIVLFCGTASAPTRTTTSATSVSVVRYIWQGSLVSSIPVAIEVNGWISTATRNIIVNVTSINSGLVVATGSSALTPNTSVINLTINPANISTTQAIWEVSFRISATTATASISTVTIIY